MNPQIENSITEIADKVRDRVEDAVNIARQSTDQAAGRLTRRKKPVKTISRLGLKLSGVTHRTANKLWKQQTKLVESQIDAVAGRLKAAAEAADLRDLVQTQVRLFPENTARIAGQAREALGTVKSAGGEMADLVKGTVAELRGQKPIPKNKADAHKADAHKATAKAPAAKTPTAEATVVETAQPEQAA